MGECGARTPTPGYGSRSTLPIGASRPGSGARWSSSPCTPRVPPQSTGRATGVLHRVPELQTRVCRLPPLHSRPPRPTSTKPQSILSTVAGLLPVRITVPSLSKFCNSNLLQPSLLLRKTRVLADSGAVFSVRQYFNFLNLINAHTSSPMGMVDHHPCHANHLPALCCR